MQANLQHYFRFYLAFVLLFLLAAGIHFQAAPLGADATAQDQAHAMARAGNQPSRATSTVALN